MVLYPLNQSLDGTGYMTKPPQFYPVPFHLLRCPLVEIQQIGVSLQQDCKNGKSQDIQLDILTKN